MKIRLRDASDFIKYSEREVEANLDLPFSTEQGSLITEAKLPTNKSLKFLLVKGKSQKIITDSPKSLKELGFTENDSIQVEEQELLTLPTDWVIALSYIGPVIVFTGFFFYRGASNCNTIHYFALLATYLHYIRRVLESLYIMKSGKEQFPVLSSYFFGLMLYYWGIYGALVGYSVFSTDKFASGELALAIGSLLFLYAEDNNRRCHAYLAGLKAQNNGQRAIPMMGLYKRVSSAHYFWELLSWAAFSFVVRCVGSYFFVLTSFLSMANMALKKHRSHLAFFGEKYPRDRKAFIPYLL